MEQAGLNNQQAYWDSVSEKKEFTTLLDISMTKPFITTESFIADFGCGYGRTLNQLWKQGYRNSIGFDFSAEMINRGKREFPHLNLKVAENNSINLGDNTADMVILFAVLTCIIYDEDQQKLMKEIKRVLKPGGIVYINDFLTNDDERNRKRYTAFLDKYKKYGVFELPEGAVLRHHEEKWIELLTKDFIREEIKHTTFKTMNGNLSNGFMYVGRKSRTA